jgi:hypothetical protein
MDAETEPAEDKMNLWDVRRGKDCRIRSLTLLGWHGIAGSFVINQLQQQPLLRNVETIVKTERADSRIWRQITDAQQKSERQDPLAYPAAASQPRVANDVENRDSRSCAVTLPNEVRVYGKQFVLQECIATQAIVQVGSRLARRPGRPYVKGEGLQIGYESYCLLMGEGRSRSTDLLSTQIRESGIYTEERTASRDRVIWSEQEECTAGSRVHVILQGRQETSLEAAEIEEMFERSIVRCNHCKQRIVI